MNGSAISMAAKIARILGTKTSVISWIWVSACKSEMTTPTTRPISISGLATRTSVTRASRATSRTSGPVMTSLPCSRASDRHRHDALVGLDDAVAHRHHRLDRNLGLRNRGDHIDHVGLAGDHRAGLGIGFVAGFGDRVERVLEHGAERRAVAGLGRGADGLAEAGGRIGEPGDVGIGTGGER